jgi:hypothetical protein
MFVMHPTHLAFRDIDQDKILDEPNLVGPGLR